MTTIAASRPVRRVSSATVRSRGRAREVIIELHPPGRDIVFRLKGERRRYALPLSVAYCFAVQSHVAAEKARRKAERSARKANA